MRVLASISDFALVFTAHQFLLSLSCNGAHRGAGDVGAAPLRPGAKRRRQADRVRASIVVTK